MCCGRRAIEREVAKYLRSVRISCSEPFLVTYLDRIGAHNLELSQRERFDFLDQEVKIATRSIQTRLTNLRRLIENQGLENKALHQKTLNFIEVSTSKVLGSVGSEGDATRASIAKSEAVILERMQQLNLPQNLFKSHQKIILIGLGGVGKSQIASNYANQLRKHNKSLSYVWVDSNTEDAFVDSYRKILGQIPKEYREDQLKIIRRSPEALDENYTDAEVLRLVCDWFSSKKAGRWLMVLDNADNLNMFSVSGFGHLRLKAALPQSDSGRLLITSRTEQVSFELMDVGKECVIPVTPMTPKQAETMFRTFLPNDNSTDDEISQLAKKLDFLPLAIRQATSFISRSSGRITIASYSQLFDTAAYQSRLLKKEFPDSTRPEDMTNAVAATWQISFRAIEKERPIAAEMLAFIGVLSTEGIPVFLLKAIQPDELEFEQDLGMLIQYSLVDQDARKDLLSLHRLVQLSIMMWLSDNNAQTQWHAKAFVVLRDAFLKAMSASGPKRPDMATCRALRIHVINICRYKFESAISMLDCQELMTSVKEFDRFSLTWLKAGDVTKIHHAKSIERVKGTTDWLFDHSTFQNWISSPGQLLWVTGEAGSGKTVLSSSVIDHFIYLGSMPAHNFKLLFFYFQYNMESKADLVFRELLRQFCSGEDQIPSAVEDMTTKYDSTSEMPSIDDTLVIFRSVIKESKKKVIVVIDALDECPQLSRGDMLNALLSCNGANIPNLYFFISSRMKKDIYYDFRYALCIRMGNV
ncbi:hypothetical protein BofuT4_P009190.1 [Botrytis cinerea T4]|uniref:NACHT domain-containing protein n=1 Tax=Botryotinia fuckeliana (strain T4) TaxID=999810 RepID=G2XXC4_BOTF4|nr:hypothetical protein BofuT4_P009190.1 [Botrytis cinerea T4]